MMEVSAGLSLSDISNKLTRDQEDNIWTPELTFLQISASFTKLVGIPVILATLPCNGFAFELKNKKDYLFIN